MTQKVQYTVVRQPRRAKAPYTGEFRAAAARVDITPSVSSTLAGYGPGAPHALGALGRCWARLILIDDGHGERLVLGSIDLQSATSPIVEKIGASLVDQHLDVARIHLTATHTHRAPGRLYGHQFYDNNNSGRGNGFDERTCKWIAARCVDAIRDMALRLTACKVEYGENVAWGRLFQRSMEAFRGNGSGSTKEEQAESAITELHERLQVPPLPAAMSDLRSRGRAVDPMIRTLTFRHADDDSLIGCFSLVSTHGTSLAKHLRYVSGDWISLAATSLERNLTSDGKMPVIAIGSGAQGDSNACPPSLLAYPYSTMIEKLRTRFGGLNFRLLRGFAADWSNLVRGSIDSGTMIDSPSIKLGYKYAMPKGASVLENYRDFGDGIDSHPKLSNEPKIGKPMLGGSELAQLDRFTEFITANEGRERRKRKGAHGTKKAAALSSMRLKPSTVPSELPIRTITISHATPSGRQPRVCLVGIPGEVTAFLSSWIAEDVRAKLGAESGKEGGPPVMLSALTGEYSGYWTTRPEYDEQHYEGASTLWGESAGGFLRQSVVEALDSTTSIKKKTLNYTNRVKDKNERPKSSIYLKNNPELRPYRGLDDDLDSSQVNVFHSRVIEREDGRLHEITLFFRTPRNRFATPALGLNPLLTLVEDTEAGGVVENPKGVAVNDQNYPSTINVNIDDAGGRKQPRPIRWEVRWHISVNDVSCLDECAIIVGLGSASLRFQSHVFE